MNQFLIYHKRIIFLISLFIVGSLLRVVMIMVFPDSVGISSDRYHHNAASLVAWGVYGWGKEPNAINAPLLPLMLALIYKIFGINAYYGTIFCIFLSSLTIIFIYLLAKEVFNNTKIALSAAIITTIYPPFLIESVPVATDVPFMLFIVISTYLSIKAIKINKLYLFILSGVMWGLSSLLRAEGMLLPFVILFFIAIRRRNLFLKAALMVMVSIVVELPWMLRNLKKFDYFGISAKAGLNLWIGAQAPNYITGVVPWASHGKVKTQFPQYKNLSDTQLDKVLFQEAVKLIIENPIKYMSLMIEKLYWLYTAPAGLPVVGGVSLKKLIKEGKFGELFKLKEFKIKLAMYIPHFLILILGLVGIFYSLRLKFFYSQLLLLVIFYFTLVYLIFMAIPRYNIPIMPSFIIFSSLFICFLFKSSSAAAFQKDSL